MKPDDIATRLKEIRGRGAQHRVAAVVPSGIDLERRTVELSFSSENDKVERWFGFEVLGHGPGEVTLSRITNGAPVLWMHDKNDQRGVVEAAWIGADRKGRAVVKFSRSPAGDQLFQDICDGIVSKVSVGYTVEGLEHIGERDGVPIYLATAWMPTEISMVSVPADDSVGVGRSARSLITEETRAWQQPTAERQHKEASQKMNEIAQVIASAQNAPGDMPHLDGEGNVRAVTSRPQASRGVFSLRTMEMQAPLTAGHRAGYFPTGTDTTKKTKVSASVLAISRVLQAGAQFILAESAAGPVSTKNGILITPRRETGFTIVEPAPFALVIDGDEVAESQPSIHREYVDLDTMRTFAYRVKLSRAEQKHYDNGELAEYTKTAILIGLGRLVDQVALASVSAQNDGPFSLAKAAAFGASFGEIRALVGTGGHGAVIGEDGTLRAAGVPAELTAEMAPTLVGAWRNAAVAVYEDITFLAHKTSINGDMALTCHVDVECLLPRPEAFWTVAA